jgi:antagonist of KipI
VSAVLEVERGGLQTTVQDLGRGGHRAFGIPPGGAMDRFALIAANRLVGNPDAAAGLECALQGPTLLVLQSCLVAVTGGDLTPRVNGEEIPTWTGLFLAAGDRLAFGGRRSGARAYLGVAGGLAGDRWLGSAATSLLIGRGGLSGRSLREGDRLTLAGEPARPQVAGRHLAAQLLPPYSSEPRLPTVRGPHFMRLDRDSRARFWKAQFEVSKDADRMGYRLQGVGLVSGGRDILSIGLAMGVVQLPPSGDPILLMADHQSAGGYPVVAGVARAGLPLAAQLLPGEKLSFQERTVEQAQDDWRRLRAALDSV